jgi:drug/metabolite transporter (DMT)-like permease
MPAFSTPAFWGCIVYLSIVSSVMAFLLLNYGSSYVSVSEASIFANLTTVISIAAGIIFVNETFTLWQIIGAIIIVGSVYISSTNKE